MTSDDERREVARRLREPFDVLGQGRYVALNGTLFGMQILASDERTLRAGISRLADLIEPVERMCLYYDSDTNHCGCYDTRLIDRDALLALADDLDRMGDGSMYDPCISDEYGIARRIREALGVK